MPRSPATIVEVRCSILPEFDRASASPTRVWRVEGPVAGGTEAEIFRARCASDGADVAIKVYRPGFDGRERVAQRFDRQQVVHAWMRTGTGLAVPRPLAVVAEPSAIVMEWIAETSLERRLLWRKVPRPERDGLLEAAGRWLRHYHCRTSFGSSPMQPARELQALRKRIPRSSGITRLEELGEDFLALFGALEAAVPRIERERLTVAVQHGDYTPKNVLCGPTRTVGIDINGGYQRHVLHDVCRFLVRLESDALVPTPRAALGSYGLHPLDHAAFMRGYLRPGETLPEPALLFAQLTAIVVRWAAIARPRQGIAATALRPIRLRRLLRMGRIVARGLAGT